MRRSLRKHASHCSFFDLDLPQSIFRTLRSVCLKPRSGTGNSKTNLISMWPYTELLCHRRTIPSGRHFKHHCGVYGGSCLTHRESVRGRDLQETSICCVHVWVSICVSVVRECYLKHPPSCLREATDGSQTFGIFCVNHTNDEL